MIRQRSPDEPPQYVMQLVLKASERSGNDIAIVERPISGMDYFVGIRPDGFQTIVYDSALRMHRDHFLVAGCAELSRFYSQPPNEQIIATPRNPMRLPDDLENAIRKLGGQIDEQRVRRVSQSLYKHFMLQLLELPGQIRIERELQGKHPQHEFKQQAYLLDRAKRASSIAHDYAIYAPEMIHDASLAMSVATASEAARTAGVKNQVFDLSPMQSNHLVFLRGILNAADRTSGHLGDRAVVDGWAEYLGVRDWFEWNPLRADQ